MSRLAPCSMSIALAAVMALAGHADVAVVAVAVVGVQALVAAAPSPVDARGHTVHVPTLTPVAVASAVATTLAVRPSLIEGASGSAVDSGQVTAPGSLAGLLPAVVLGTFAVLGMQLRVRKHRRDVAASTGYAVALTTVAALASGWITGFRAAGDEDVLVVCAAGMAGALAVWSVPLDRWVVGGVSIVGGAAAGAGATTVLDGALTPFYGVVVGGSIAVFAVLGQVLGRAWCRRRRLASSSWGFPGAMAVALAGPLVHVGGQLASAL